MSSKKAKEGPIPGPQLEAPAITAFSPQAFEPDSNVQSVTITLPIGPIPEDAFVARHVEVRLDNRQAVTLKRLWYGYDGLGTRLASGKRPDGNADIVRLLLEAVADELDKTPEGDASC